MSVYRWFLYTTVSYVPRCLCIVSWVCTAVVCVHCVSCVPHCVLLLSMQHCFVRKTESVYRCFLYTILLRFSHLVYCVGHIALFTSALKKHALERSHLETEQEILRLFFFYSWECYWHRQMEIKAFSGITQDQSWNGACSSIWLVLTLSAIVSAKLASCSLISSSSDRMLLKPRADERAAVRLFATSDISALGKI